MSFFSIFLSSIIDIKNFSSWEVSSLRTNLWSELVNNSCISKSSSSHNFIISSSGTIGIVIVWLNIFRFKISGSRWVLCNITSRGDMISCNWVTEPSQTIGTLDFSNLWEFSGGGLEKWWVMNISWSIFPWISLRWLNIKTIPTVITFSDSSINFFKHFCIDMLWDNFFNLCPWWPQISQKYIFTIWVFGNWLGFIVDVHSTGNCKGNNKWRRS